MNERSATTRSKRPNSARVIVRTFDPLVHLDSGVVTQDGMDLPVADVNRNDLRLRPPGEDSR